MSQAVIESAVDSPAIVAAALAPDNTDDLETRVESGAVVTTIERDRTASLEATVDDYVRSLDVAVEVVQRANQHTPHNP